MESMALEMIPLDDQVEDLVNTTPTILNFDPDDATAQALISDLSMGMHKYSTIAQRYGLTMTQLYEFVKIPEVRRRIKSKKAIWESDDNLPERNKRYYATITLEAAPVVDRLLHNPATPPGHLIKAIEVSGRLGGVDVKPNANDTGPVAERFSVVFQFSHGASEKFTVLNEPAPPTIDGDPVS